MIPNTTRIVLLAFGSLAMAQDPGAIYGVVRDPQTQMPIEGARVYLAPFALRLPDPLFPTLKPVTDSFIGFETTTDASGRYRFSGLPAHRYCLSTRKEGYWWVYDDMCQVGMVRTAPGRNLERDLTLDRAPVLRGRLVDNVTGAPIAGLRVVTLQNVFSGGIRQWISYYGMKPGKGPGEFEIQPPWG